MAGQCDQKATVGASCLRIRPLQVPANVCKIWSLHEGHEVLRPRAFDLLDAGEEPEGQARQRDAVSRGGRTR